MSNSNIRSMRFYNRVRFTEYVETGHLDAFVFIVCDMKKFVTMYYLITESEIQSKYYDVYASRGDMIMPEVEEVVRKRCLRKSNH